MVSGVDAADMMVLSLRKDTVTRGVADGVDER
jgi:hypothetical protein